MLKERLNIFYFFLVLFPACCASFSFAQTQGASIDQEIQQLLKELKATDSDTEKMYLLSDLSFIHGESNPSKGLDYGFKAMEIAERLDWPRGLAYVQNNLGNLYSMLSNHPKALDFYFKALKNNEIAGHEAAIASNYGNIGAVFLRMKENDKALTYYHKSLSIERKRNNLPGISSDLLNIGVIYRQMGDLDKALKYCFEALEMDRQIGNTDGIAANLVNIGSVYEEKAKYREALKFYLDSKDLDEKRGNLSGMGSNYGSLGSVYLKILKDTSLTSSEKAKLAGEGNSLPELIRENLFKAKELLEKTGALYELRLVFRNLSDISVYEGDYKSALEYFKEHKRLQDSIFSKENESRIMGIEFKRDSDLKQKEIEIQKLQLSRAKTQQMYLVLGLLLLSVIAVMLIQQRAKSESLLLNILPQKIAQRLKKKEYPIADQFENASIVFIDIVGFTDISGQHSPKDLVALLNTIFTKLDVLVEKYGLEKIKTIGDCYMAVAGVPVESDHHADDVAKFAIEAREQIKGHLTPDGRELAFRTGIDAGAVVAGVIGKKKFIYDLWGDAVNTASRMESSGEQGRIQITDRFRKMLKESYHFIPRGVIQIKGKGQMETFFLEKSE